MKSITVMPWGPHAGRPIEEIPDAYILSLIAPQRLRVALPRDLEAAPNAEWARRRKAELRAGKGWRKAA